MVGILFGWRTGFPKPSPSKRSTQHKCLRVPLGPDLELSSTLATQPNSSTNLAPKMQPLHYPCFIRQQFRISHVALSRCPRDCVLNDWTAWTACDPYCSGDLEIGAGWSSMEQSSVIGSITSQTWDSSLLILLF